MASAARTVLVTGASRGLGLEFVKQLAARGDRVIAACRNPGAVPELKAMGAGVRAAALDVADPLSIKSFVADLGGEGVDVLINNAGLMGEDNRVGAMKLEEMRRIFDVNTFGPALLTQAVLPNLIKGQRKLVVNITSTLGSISAGMPGMSYAYCASKAALNKISVKMAWDLKSMGIIVVSMCPGWNKTDMGGGSAPLEPKDSIGRILTMMDTFGLADSGTFRREDGAVVPF
jgi:NAD(P)-dependent dehydrogenase (short-subunit alcohol dehydrogenase family)